MQMDYERVFRYCREFLLAMFDERLNGDDHIDQTLTLAGPNPRRWATAMGLAYQAYRQIGSNVGPIREEQKDALRRCYNENWRGRGGEV